MVFNATTATEYLDATIRFTQQAAFPLFRHYPKNACNAQLCSLHAFSRQNDFPLFPRFHKSLFSVFNSPSPLVVDIICFSDFPALSCRFIYHPVSTWTFSCRYYTLFEPNVNHQHCKKITQTVFIFFCTSELPPAPPAHIKIIVSSFLTSPYSSNYIHWS